MLSEIKILIAALTPLQILSVREKMKEEVMTCLQSLYVSHIINTPKVATLILGSRQEEHEVISTADYCYYQLFTVIKYIL